MNTYTLIGSAALKCTRSQRPGDAATTLLVDLSRRTPAVRQTSPLQSSQRRLRAPDVTATVFLAQAATKRHRCRTQRAVTLPSVHDTLLELHSARRSALVSYGERRPENTSK